MLKFQLNSMQDEQFFTFTSSILFEAMQWQFFYSDPECGVNIVNQITLQDRLPAEPSLISGNWLVLTLKCFQLRQTGFQVTHFPGKKIFPQQFYLLSCT